jgi:glycosyltransferase involved in cell wall biosynthesis
MLLPQAADPTVMATDNTPASSVVRMLHVGRLVELKGIGRMLDALAAVAQHVRITFAGDGPLRAELAEQAHRLGIDATFLGSLPPHELPGVYRDADVLLFPTLADEWGLVVNEALGSGVPVLGSVYSQAVEELVRPGRNGWLFNPDDPASVADAVQSCLADLPVALDSYRQAARDSVAWLTPDHVAERIGVAVSWAAAGARGPIESSTTLP